MNYKRWLVLPLAATVVLTACGKDDTSDEPGKISEHNKTSSNKEDNKDSAKQQNKDNQSKSDNKSENKAKNSKSEDGQSVVTNEESKNKVLAEGEKSKKFGKNDMSAKNDKKKLPKDLQDDGNETFLTDSHYIDLEGSKDISEYVEERTFENPELVAPDSTHESAYKQLTKIWEETQSVSKENTKLGSSGSVKQSDNIDKLTKNYYYGDDNLVQKMVMYGMQDWHIDKSSLELTDYGAENVWMYKYDFVNSKGEKVASIGGKYYDVIHQQTVMNTILSNKGAEELYGKIKYAQNDKRPK